MNQIELCNYIENLRYDRNITQEELVAGICDIRTYKRYRKGTHKIPLQVIIGFSDKLKINAISMLTDFERINQEQSEMLNVLYNSLADSSDKAQHLIEVIDEKRIIDIENKLYYKYSLLILDLNQKKLSSLQFVNSVLQLIDYSKILKKQKLTDVEVLILSSLLDYSGSFSKNVIVEKLDNFLQNKNQNFISKNKTYIIPLILMRLSKYYGSQGNLEKVYKYCNLGIENSNISRNIYLLEYFHYYLSLVNFKRRDLQKFYDSIFQTFNCLYLNGNKSKIEKFSKLIKKDFNLVYSSFMKNYLDAVE